MKTLGILMLMVLGTALGILFFAPFYQCPKCKRVHDTKEEEEQCKGQR